MRKITDIYKEYKIMPNLQEHMFRVAGVASLICDNFNESFNKKDIIIACLLHDIGNIIKFDLNYFPELNKPEGLEYWQNVQNEYIKNYGKNEYVANTKIAHKIGVSEWVLELINSISFLGAPSNVLDRDFAKKIVSYSDERVNPFGVVSLEQRFVDLGKRYVNHSSHTFERNTYENALREIEKQIFSKCKIKPEDINDDSVKLQMEKLKDFEI